MKDATGELSTTVIAIVAISLILAVFTVFLLPMLRSQIALTQACNNGPGYSLENGDGSKIQCDKAKADGTWECKYINEAEQETGSKTCEQ